MPRATANISDTKRFELKSCPEGYVVLRRLTYGQFLERQENAMDITMKRGEGKEAQSLLEMAQTRTAVYEFKMCIVEHNLTDDNDNPLDFKQAFTIQMLDPRIGQEIGVYINEMNQFEEEVGK